MAEPIAWTQTKCQIQLSVTCKMHRHERSKAYSWQKGRAVSPEPVKNVSTFCNDMLVYIPRGFKLFTILRYIFMFLELTGIHELLWKLYRCHGSRLAWGKGCWINPLICMISTFILSINIIAFDNAYSISSISTTSWIRLVLWQEKLRQEDETKTATIRFNS